MKKLLSLVLALMLVLLAVPALAVTPVQDLSGQVIILHTNDVHGRAQSTDANLGYARVLTIKKALEANGAQVLLVDDGDFSQGAPIVNLTQGANAVDFMNQTGYELAAVGNHEFDWGTDNLLQILQDAQFTVLCANLRNTADDTLVFPANKTIEFANGIKMGVFGLATPETMTKAHPDKVKGVTFSMAEELYADAQAQVDELTAAGCNYIVCMGHLGVDEGSAPNRSIDVMENVTGINLFIDGHSHTVLDQGAAYGDGIIVSTGSYSEALGYVVLTTAEAEEGQEGITVNTSAGLFTVAENAEAAFVGAGVTPDADLDAYIDSVQAKIEEELSAPFATSEVLLNGEREPGVRTEETNLGDFSADAILWSARKALGEDKVQLAITNGGGIRATIEAGEMSMLTMKTVFPFGNEVAVVTVTGAELLEALEAATYCTPTAVGAFPQVSGIEFTIDTTVEYVTTELYPDTTYGKPDAPGSRVTITTVDGQPFDPEAMYTIATNDFVAAGGDTYYALKYPFTQTGYRTGVALEDALVDYTQNVLNGVVGQTYAEPAGRIVIK